jgi:hypothetical protein
MTQGFSLETDDIALPQGAFAGTHRQTLRHNGNPVLALTQGRRRAYVFPLFTPKGFAVTTESPADHPHHNSLWFAADHFHLRMPTGPDRFEEYTYNFYVDDTFQGRAPGSLIVKDTKAQPDAGGGIAIVQNIEWRGPVEWAAPMGRHAASETRTMRISAEDGRYVMDIESRLRSAEFDFSLGPTRHAYFNVRVAESMTVPFGGVLQDDQGRKGGAAITGVGAKWIDYSGPVGGGNVAGISVFPDPRDHEDLSWFVTDWGVVTIGPFRLKQRIVRKGDEIVARYRVIVHDGDAAACDPAALYKAFVAGVQG